MKHDHRLFSQVLVDYYVMYAGSPISHPREDQIRKSRATHHDRLSQRSITDVMASFCQLYTNVHNMDDRKRHRIRVG
jgi:hypothetical protein